MRNTLRILSAAVIAATVAGNLYAKAAFPRDFSPSEGVVTPAESEFRKELCLNGLWDFQPVAASKKLDDDGIPALAKVDEYKWEKTKIKIPSPWNINEWGGGQKTGEGSDKPYAPNSVYFPSYPESWSQVEMGWLRRDFDIPESWENLHVRARFEAVAGEASLYINGKFVAKHFDSRLPFDTDITKFLKPGKNEIKLGVRHAKFFKSEASGTAADNMLGIWQDAYVLAFPQVYVSNVFVKPNVCKDILEIEVTLTNTTRLPYRGEMTAFVREWINENQALAKANELKLDDGQPLGNRLDAVLDAAEISWALSDDNELETPQQKVSIEPGNSAVYVLSVKAADALKKWTPAEPNLYGALVTISSQGHTSDIKYARFGWREITFDGFNFLLNGEKITVLADMQKEFEPYALSRRFAYAWYQTVKSFGGNAVRPAGQLWPEHYYKLADEMGIMVLCETGIRGDIPAPTPEDAWQRAKKYAEYMVKRYRNNPSVIGWSIDGGKYSEGLAANAKISDEEKAETEAAFTALIKRVRQSDPTRPFVTVDNAGDLGGALPVWNRRFGDGFILNQILKAKENLNFAKPIVISEFGAAPYAMPPLVWKYFGDKVYESYAGLNDALAVDLYKNAAEASAPASAYFSAAEIVRFGLEPLNYGYSDFSRLPNKDDGVFAGRDYEEFKPGCQFERIPAYVYTLNPGIDAELPFIRPLAQYSALKAAIAGQPCDWDKYELLKKQAPEALPQAKFADAYFVGNTMGELFKKLVRFGVKVNNDNEKPGFVIVDGENLSEEWLNLLKNKIMPALAETPGSVLIVMSGDKDLDENTRKLFDKKIETYFHESTSMLKADSGTVGDAFTLADLYFVYGNPNQRAILKQSFGGDFLEGFKTVFKPANVDWNLYDTADSSKCAQVVLYENMQKKFGAALLEKQMGQGKLYVSALNYKLASRESDAFFKRLFGSMGLEVSKGKAVKEKGAKKQKAPKAKKAKASKVKSEAEK